MYVCNCHGFNEKEVKRALRAGLRTVSGICRHMDHRPQCGKCIPDIVRLLKEEQANDAQQYPLAEAAD
ncbi:MAG: bacterioferritin-associated ferredoxin [Azospirillum sp.]|nr:bacterioferritin-associated ferredoxin [Azospirillum sp.]